MMPCGLKKRSARAATGSSASHAMHSPRVAGDLLTHPLACEDAAIAAPQARHAEHDEDEEAGRKLEVDRCQAERQAQRQELVKGDGTDNGCKKLVRDGAATDDRFADDERGKAVDENAEPHID